MNLSLYSMTSETAALLDAIEDAGGEITPAVQTRLDALATALPAKADAICRLVRHFQARATAIDLEAVRLREAAARDESAARRLKKYLADCLQLAGQRKVSTELFGVSLCASPVAIAWNGSTDQLPEQFRRTKVELDNQAARKFLAETGALPEGFSVIESMHVRIS